MKSYQIPPSFFILKNNKVIESIIKLGIVLGCIITIYGQDLSVIFSKALDFGTDNIANYLLVLPFLMMYVVYRKRHAIKSAIHPNKISSLLEQTIGLSICIVSVLLFLFGSTTFYVLELHLISFVLFGIGSIIFLFNLETFKQSFFVFVLAVFFIPPPSEFINYLVSDLVPVIANLVYLLLNATGIETSLGFVSDEFPRGLTVSMSDGIPITFRVGSPSSGLYSMTTLMSLGLFIGYIIDGKIWKRILMWILGIPIMFLLNVLRIDIMITLWYYFGETVAESFHAISGSIMIAIGAVILLVFATKVLRVQINPFEDTTGQKNPKKTSPSDFTNTKRSRFGKNSISKIMIILLVTIIISANHIPIGSSFTEKFSERDDTNQTLDIKSLNGQESEILMPQIDGWDLEFYSREYKIEQDLRHDLWIMFKYAPVNFFPDTTQPVLYSAIDIGDYVHRWESSLTWHEKPKEQWSSILDQTDIPILDDTEGRFLAYQKPDSHSTEAVLYWIENIPITIDSDIVPRYIHLHVLSNMKYLADIGLIDGEYDYKGAQRVLSSFAEPIAKYWKDRSIESVSNPFAFLVNWFNQFSLEIYMFVGSMGGIFGIFFLVELRRKCQDIIEVKP